MNKTALVTITAVLAAAALVIGTFASPAFADSSSTTTLQINKQTITNSGGSINVQFASNCITLLSGSNSCRIG